MRKSQHFALLTALALWSTAIPPSQAQGAAHKATGMVTKVEKDKVTIKHEPVQSMNWPAMTMGFIVKDKAILDKMAKDKKVDFEFVQQGKDYVITSAK